MPKWKAALLNLCAWGFGLVRLADPIARLILRAWWLSGLRHRCQIKIPSSTQLEGAVQIVGTGNLTLGEYCRLGRNVLFETNGNGRIVIGNRVRINDGSTITAHAGISIGDDVLVGEYVSIRDANHGIERGKLIRSQVHQCDAITIGSDVWIGRGCCILKGITIGNGAVVGANSVVTSDVDGNVIVAGAPARAIGARSV